MSSRWIYAASGWGLCPLHAFPGPSPPHTPPWSPQDQSRASSQLLLPTPQVSRAFVGGVGREGAGVWNCGSGFWVRELSARQACEADLTLSSQSVAICSSDPVQPAVAHEGRGGFLEAWFWLRVWERRLNIMGSIKKLFDFLIFVSCFLSQ